MPGIKLLLTGRQGEGKSSALGTLDPKKALVINIDGKTFGFPIPHVNINEFHDVDELIDTINEAVEAYTDGYGHPPEVLAIDTLSRIYNNILANCQGIYSGFEVYSNVGKEVHKVNNLIQDIVNSGMDVVITSHVLFSESDDSWIDASVGQQKKTGGCLSVFDHTAFMTVQKGKYEVYHRHPVFPCRSLLPADTLPSKMKADDYDLNEHIKLIRGSVNAASKFTINLK